MPCFSREVRSLRTVSSETYQLPGGGISKVNIATDIELAFPAAIGENERHTSQWCSELDPEVLARGREGAKELVKDKIYNYLHSNDKAF